MVEITKTEEFDKALKGIGDRRAAQKILVQIDRLAAGNPGKAESVGDGVSELKINYGPGYRVYYTQIGKQIVLLLTCGNKGSQDKDIKDAKALKADYT